MSDLKTSFARLRTLLKAHVDSVPPQVRLSCEEIEVIQRRLGTTAERPEDAHRVRLLVHELNNFCTRLTLGHGI